MPISIMRPDFDAVIWDFGGVITTSPFDAFARYERERGLPVGIIRHINASNPNANAWARFERSEVDAAAFDRLFAAEAAALGHAIPGADVIALLAGDIRPRMVLALDQLKQAGFVLGCITNNVAAGEGAGMARDAQAAGAVGAILARFDHVIESSKAGVRKPDPAIYRMMLDRIGIVAERAIYLDDLGINCKPAAALGMTAIKVLSEDQALRQLSALVCLDLG